MSLLSVCHLPPLVLAPTDTCSAIVVSISIRAASIPYCLADFSYPILPSFSQALAEKAVVSSLLMYCVGYCVVCLDITLSLWHTHTQHLSYLRQDKQPSFTARGDYLPAIRIHFAPPSSPPPPSISTFSLKPLPAIFRSWTQFPDGIKYYIHHPDYQPQGSTQPVYYLDGNPASEYRLTRVLVRNNMAWATIGPSNTVMHSYSTSTAGTTWMSYMQACVQTSPFWLEANVCTFMKEHDAQSTFCSHACTHTSPITTQQNTCGIFRYWRVAFIMLLATFIRFAHSVALFVCESLHDIGLIVLCWCLLLCLGVIVFVPLWCMPC